MLGEWFLNEGYIVFRWWLLVTLAGAAAMPWCARLLSGLPDRGYTLARAVGMLLVGFVFWSLASLGFLRNTPGSMLLAWLIVAVGGIVVYVYLPHADDRPTDWRSWWAENWRVLIAAELIFAVMLLGWAMYRAAFPNLTATEKPMEMAFISGVMRSETFPPVDPWMAGYSISYYYFGYVMAGMLSSLSGVSSAIGFNMMISLLFALTGLNTFGVVYNLVRSRAFDVTGALRAVPRPSRELAMGFATLGLAFVVLIGNFQLPFIELPYQARVASEGYLRFWNTQARTEPSANTSATVTQVGPFEFVEPFWWWFRASRVLTEYDLPVRDENGEWTKPEAVTAQPIDEFPQFSFLLADVHPHVLALPFAVLGLGLALNLLLTWRNPTRYEIVFYALALGGLIFLNTWDGPIYMVVLVGAEALRRLMRSGSGRLSLDDWVRVVGLLLAMGALAFVFYLPWFVSFRSQASGILPNVIYPTPFRQYFIMFGPFILLLAPFLAMQARTARVNWPLGWTVAGGLWVVLVVLSLVLIVAAWFSPLRPVVLRFVVENGGWGQVLPLLLLRRVTHILTAAALVATLAVIVARLFPKLPSEPGPVVTYPRATGFALLIIAAGAVLSLVPEYVYLRDNFSVRINTIFKFYYQGWVMFGIAAAYGAYVVLFAADSPEDPRKAGDATLIRRVVYASMLVQVLGLGLLYPILGIHNRAVIESGRALEPREYTLDGGPSLATNEDYLAIICLSQIVEGDDVVVAEAIGPAYNWNYGRVGVLTGLPIVLGWEGHQRQWRGNTYGSIAGTRRADIEQLYNELRWEEAQRILEQYDIDYIFYGNTERNGIPSQPGYSAAGEAKFEENLEVVCERGNSRFYKVTPTALEIAEAP